MGPGSDNGREGRRSAGWRRGLWGCFRYLLLQKARGLAALLHSDGPLSPLVAPHFSISFWCLACPLPDNRLFYLFSYMEVLVPAGKIFHLFRELFSCSIWDLVPWPGKEPWPLAFGAQTLSHWTTRNVPNGLNKLFSATFIWACLLFCMRTRLMTKEGFSVKLTWWGDMNEKDVSHTKNWRSHFR